MTQPAFLKTGLILLFSVAIMLQTGYAQRGKILEIQRALDTLRQAMPLEKMYIHTDKSDYILGDTIWYKVYAMDGIVGIPSLVSGIVYVELLDPEGKLMQRSRQVLVAGSTYGDFLLDPAVTAAGRFTIRAYTRWLQNFGEDFFYQQYIDVAGDYLQDWTVNLAPVTLTDSAGVQRVSLEMTLQHLNGRRLDVQPVEMEVLRRGRAMVRNRTVVDTLGRLHLDFGLPTRMDARDLEVVIHSDEAVKARFALREGLPSTRYDVQFLPESGRWLVGAPQVMGVKAIDEQGKGVRAEGVILDAGDREVARFTCWHKGMGRVEFPAFSGGTYRARLQFPDGTEETYPLPVADTEGVLVQYRLSAVSSTHVPLQIRVSPAYRDTELLLTAVSNGTLHYGGLLNPKDSLSDISIPRKYLPEGMVHFAVLDPSGRPLASRLVYHHTGAHRLGITVSPDRDVYGTRDSVALRIKVTDGSGNPVQGNFSMAVTDDSQIKVNPLKENIYSRYFLSAELKGHVEDPGFYFSADTLAAVALDNLLLTQGWVRYDQTIWPKNRQLAYSPEPYFRVGGTVKNALGNAVEKANVVLLSSSGSAAFFADTLTDDRGKFLFDEIPSFDTAGFVIQARNRRNKSFNIGIDLDMDAQPPLLPMKPAAMQKSWFVNLDTSLQRRVLDHLEHQQQLHFGESSGDLKSIMLQEVEVTGKKIVLGSKNLNGPGEADQSLVEDELLERADKTLLDILEEKIDGFRLGIFPPRIHGKPEFMVNDKKARLIFDGMDLEFFYDPERPTLSPREDHMEFLKSYLQQYSGEDVLGVEVMYSMRYSNRYNSRHLSSEEILAKAGQTTVYIEITTRNGNGPFMRKTPGVVHFRPMPFAWPREFYRPRYAVAESDTPAMDLRSTIHWEPMVFTDENGEALVSFYATDRPGSYTVWLEGMDGNGNFGVMHRHMPVNEAGSLSSAY